LKLENLQHTGSFKPRGAFNRLSDLTASEKKKGVIASTAGNHGIALAFAGDHLKIPTRIFLPKWVDPAKLEMMHRYSPEISFFESVELARDAAKQTAQEENLTFVSAYNDFWMISGGGTVALEILENITDLDVIVLGLGGGGLASGVSLVAKAVKPDLKIYTVQPENSPLMTSWLTHNSQDSTSLKPSLAEGLSVNMELETITFPLLKDKIDAMILVSETEIKDAMVWALQEHQMYLEGAGAATLAGIMKYPFKKGLKIAGIVTGQNISLPRFYAVLQERLETFTVERIEPTTNTP
jgi:threonine dehydratase